MKKNSFAEEFRKLAKQSGIKNTVFAAAVQYDVSYISKWMGGKSLPSDKNIDIIASSLSKCVITSANEIDKLQLQYHCQTRQELQDKIYNILLDAYYETKGTEELKINQTLEDIISYVYSEMNENILAAVDIFSLGHKERLLFAGIRNGHFSFGEDCSEISYELIIDLSNAAEQVYDVIYLVHMMTGLSSFNVQLYDSRAASGKFIFSRGVFETITGLLMPNEQCLIGCSFEQDEETNGYIRQAMNKIKSQENILFQKSSISEMMSNLLYERSLISQNVCWVLGHATEMILPDMLFESLLKYVKNDSKPELRRMHAIAQQVVRHSDTKIIIYESVFSDIIVTGELDFFNHKILLSETEKLCLLDYYKQVFSPDICVNLKLISGYLDSDFKYVTNPCMFLSDMVGYVRLENGRYHNNIMVIKSQTVKRIFEGFFNEIWSNRKEVVIEDKQKIYKIICHYRDSVHFIKDVTKDM